MKQSFLVLFLLAAGASCLGDDSGGAVSGLSLPSGMDLVTVSGGAEGSATAAATNTSFPADSDFATDPVRRHVWDQAAEPLEIINDILASLAQTCADKLVNQGPYIALVEVDDEDQGGGASSNQSASGNAVEYEPWIVDSTRASSSAPQYVRFWIEGEEQFDENLVIESMIHALGEITAEADAQNPFGQFTIDYAMTEGALGQMFQRGTLSAGPASGGLAGFTFLADAVDPQLGGDVQITAETNAARTAGRARVRAMDWETQQTVQYLLAFDADHFARKTGNQIHAFDRDRFSIHTWAYNLYWAENGEDHLAGQRVDIESGFPFTFEFQGERQYGHVGYWGIWSPQAGLPAHGAVVQRDNRDGSAREYTVVRAPGKLIHVQRVELALEEIDGMDFEWWDWQTGSQYLVHYTHDAQSGIGDFAKTAAWNPQTFAWDPIEPPEDLVIQPGEWFGFWSRALGGSVSYVGGAAAVTIQEETFVSGDDGLFGNAGSLTLYGLTQCLKSALTAAQVEAGDVWLPEAQANAPWTYAFERDSRGLVRNGARVGLLPGEVPQSGPFVWGMRTGPLTDVPPEQLGVTEPWEMWNLDEFYYWETGANEWNRFAGVRDGSGKIVTFDPPIAFLYDHLLENDANGDSAYVGQTFWLEYGGSGQLWGIPHGEVDVDGDQQPDRWLPLFSLADGAVVGPEDAYVTKAIESELTMQPTLDAIPPALLAALDAAAQLVLPTLAAWTDPVDPNVPQNLGEPRVIGGKLLR